MYIEKERSNTTPLVRTVSMHGWSLAFKRVFDGFVSLFGLILLSPIFALIAIAIKRDGPGPVFYRGNRMGRGGKAFQILKFRTMYDTPESFTGAKVTVSDDSRVTPIGHWLRNTKLNELPQLWNVLKGEMSLVGPRPEDPDIARTWRQEVFQEVLSVRPGITSPASVLYRNEETLLCAENLLKKYMEEISPDKSRLDQLYVRYRSFVLDLDILFWTFLILVPKLRTYSPPETILFVGPVTRFMRRYVNWFIIDLFITFFAFSFTGIIWRLDNPLNLGWAKSIALAVSFALLFSLIETVMGVNRISWSKATFADIYDLMGAWFTSSILVVVMTTLTHGLPLGLVIGACFLTVVGLIVARYRSRLMVDLINRFLRSQEAGVAMTERVLIVGANQAGQHAAWLLSHPVNARKFSLVGFVDNDLLQQGMRMYGAKVLGRLKDTPALIKKHHISLVLLADPTEFKDEFASISEICQRHSTKFVVLPDILAIVGGLAERIRIKESGTTKAVRKPSPRAVETFMMIPNTGGQQSVESECPQSPCLHCLIRDDLGSFGLQSNESGKKM